jgi:hypothetical protein
MKSISKIAHDALNQVTNGNYVRLPKLAISGLLDDFQYVWLKQLQVKEYDFEMLDLARMFCSSENKSIFKAANCKSIVEIRERFQQYLFENCGDDDRVIISLEYENDKIDAQWLPMKEYLQAASSKET